jgi:hypothetical protein
VHYRVGKKIGEGSFGVIYEGAQWFQRGGDVPSEEGIGLSTSVWEGRRIRMPFSPRLWLAAVATQSLEASGLLHFSQAKEEPVADEHTPRFTGGFGQLKTVYSSVLFASAGRGCVSAVSYPFFFVEVAVHGSFLVCPSLALHVLST